MAHQLYPLGSSIHVSASPFCSSHSEEWVTKGPALVTKLDIFCSVVSCPRGKDTKRKKKKKMQQRTAQNIQLKALCQESSRKFYTWAKGFLVSFKNLNRDNYLDASWWIRSVCRTKACWGVLCTLRNNYFPSLFTFFKKAVYRQI